MQSRQEAEQQISASKVKMEVLSNYFKDKEKELMRYVSLCSLQNKQLCTLPPPLPSTRLSWSAVA